MESGKIKTALIALLTY